MAEMALLLSLFICAVAVFLFLLPAKLMVIVAKASPPDIRDENVADAMKWYGFAKVAAVLVPLGLFVSLMEALI